MNQLGSNLRKQDYVSKPDSSLTKESSSDSNERSISSSTPSTLDQTEKVQHNTTDITQSQEEADLEDVKMTAVSIGIPTTSTRMSD